MEKLFTHIQSALSVADFSLPFIRIRLKRNGSAKAKSGESRKPCPIRKMRNGWAPTSESSFVWRGGNYISAVYPCSPSVCLCTLKAVQCFVTSSPFRLPLHRPYPIWWRLMKQQLMWTNNIPFRKLHRTINSHSRMKLTTWQQTRRRSDGCLPYQFSRAFSSFTTGNSNFVSLGLHGRNFYVVLHFVVLFLYRSFHINTHTRSLLCATFSLRCWHNSFCETIFTVNGKALKITMART